LAPAFVHGFLFCVDAHRDGKRCIVKADDLLTAFLSLERDAIALKGAVAQQQKQIEALTATVQKVSDQVAFLKAAPRLVATP